MIFVFFRELKLFLLSVCTVTVLAKFSLIGDIFIASNALAIASGSSWLLQRLL